MDVAADPRSPLRRRVKDAVLVRPPWRIVEHRQRRFADAARFYPRGALIAQVGRAGRRVWAVSIHLGLAPTERNAHVHELTDLCAGLAGGPVVIGGDLNATPDERAVRWLADRYWDAWATMAAGRGGGADESGEGQQVQGRESRRRDLPGPRSHRADRLPVRLGRSARGVGPRAGPGRGGLRSPAAGGRARGRGLGVLSATLRPGARAAARVAEQLEGDVRGEQRHDADEAREQPREEPLEEPLDRDDRMPSCYRRRWCGTHGVVGRGQIEPVCCAPWRRPGRPRIGRPGSSPPGASCASVCSPAAGTAPA